MIAMIFAAGKGERLGKISKYYQKCILPVAGKPLIIHWLEALYEQEIEILPRVVMGYKQEQVEDMIETGRFAKRKNIHYLTREPKDHIWKDMTSYIMKNWKDKSEKRESVLLCLGDNYSTALVDIIREMLSYGNYCSVVGLIPISNCSHSKEEAITGKRVFQDQELYEIVEYRMGVESFKSTHAMACAGIGVFTPEAISLTSDLKTLPEALSLLANKGMLYGHRITQDYIDIGTPENFRALSAI